MQEVWKHIKGYEGHYQVSNLGNIKSVGRVINDARHGSKSVAAKLMSKCFSRDNYHVITLKLNRSKKTYKVHRLVAEHFISNPDNKPQVNHKNCIKTDNTVSNLEWVSNLENMRHANENNLMNRATGQRHPFSKKVICTVSGKVYNSITEAAKNNNISFWCLSQMLLGNKPNTTALSYLKTELATSSYANG